VWINKFRAIGKTDGACFISKSGEKRYLGFCALCTNVRQKADYGEEIISTLLRQLVKEFGNGFSRRNLFNMIRFVEVFSDMKIVHTLSAQLTWTHFREIIYLDDSLQHDFYAEMCSTLSVAGSGSAILL